MHKLVVITVLATSMCGAQVSLSFTKFNGLATPIFEPNTTVIEITPGPMGTCGLLKIMPLEPLSIHRQ